MTLKTDLRFHQIKLIANVLIKKDDKYIVIEKNFHKQTESPKMIHALGGHVDHGENPLETAKREVFEESDIHIKNIQLRAVVTEIKENSKPTPDWTIFHFIADYDTGEINESTEGKLLLLSQTDLLKKPILESFSYVLKHMLSKDKKIMFASFYYKNNKFIDNKKKIEFTS